jgi:hypothetical protein
VKPFGAPQENLLRVRGSFRLCIGGGYAVGIDHDDVRAMGEEGCQGR